MKYNGVERRIFTNPNYNGTENRVEQKCLGCKRLEALEAEMNVAGKKIAFIRGTLIFSSIILLTILGFVQTSSTLAKENQIEITELKTSLPLLFEAVSEKMEDMTESHEDMKETFERIMDRQSDILTKHLMLKENS